MREIKFRAWDGNEMTYWQHGKENELYHTDNFWNDRPNETVFMQYTGLLDKNGKEIYEGDIVDEYLSDCEDENYLYHGIVEYFINGFALKIKDKSYIELKNTGHNIEIIGNIYENKDLLINNQ